jgi:hypothetical protein
MRRLPPLVALALLAPLAPGCAPEGEFPSLALRPGERDLSTEPPVRAPVTVPGDPALRGLVAALAAQAEAGDRAFDAELASAAPVVARAGAAQSESWVQGQLAFSRLEASRGATTTALAELEALRVARAAQPTNEADFAAIESAIAEAARRAAAQQQRLDRLRAGLAR